MTDRQRTLDLLELDWAHRRIELECRTPRDEATRGHVMEPLTVTR